MRTSIGAPASSSRAAALALAPPSAPFASQCSMTRWQRVGPAVEHQVVAEFALGGSSSANGVISLALTIAMSSPAATQWWSITELRAARAAGLSPNDAFETPSEVRTPGIRSLMSLMPAIVSTAESTNSGSPVAKVKVNASKINAPGGKPYSPTIDVVNDVARPRASVRPSSPFPSRRSSAPRSRHRSLGLAA